MYTYVHTWRKTTRLRTRAAAEQTRKPTTTSPTLGITSSPTDNLQFVLGVIKVKKECLWLLSLPVNTRLQVSFSQTKSPQHITASNTHLRKYSIPMIYVCSQICYCHRLTACCPPHAALARTHPCPAFASMPARFNPRLRKEHISTM